MCQGSLNTNINYVKYSSFCNYVSVKLDFFFINFNQDNISSLYEKVDIRIHLPFINQRE